LANADEMPDDEHPYVLSIERPLEHQDIRATSRRASTLDAIGPVPLIRMHPEELEKIGIEPGDMAKVILRRGEVEGYARTDVRLQSK
jgi:formate dehydrogenase major subunit